MGGQLSGSDWLNVQRGRAIKYDTAVPFLTAHQLIHDLGIGQFAWAYRFP